VAGWPGRALPERGRAQAILLLLLVGAGWGLTLPLLRVAVSTGYPPLGLVLWHKAIMAAGLGAVLLVRRVPFPLSIRHADLFLAVALFGAILPGYFAFLTAAALPAGLRAVILAIVPIFVLPMALVLGFERPDAKRAAGIALGAAAIVLIALPGSGLPPTASLVMLAFALIPPLSYAVEANFLVWRGSDGLDPVQVLFGASLIGIALAWPLAAMTGQIVWPRDGWGAAEWAVLLSGVLNAGAYAGYVWLVGNAGSVFASQISYLVTGFGVLWSMLLLGERYPPGVWLALAAMMAGVALVQPAPGIKAP
jgi:drug/metabolite transporter (DMT)-like permease